MKIYTVIKRKKTTRGTSHTKQSLSKKEIQNDFPHWDGKRKLLWADARSGLVIEIEGQ
jgi:hypothetical protein